ncbi:MAG: phosphorylase, partial [Rhodocyclaceae bacterium]|nr:phosphorylase [Rhodocyclaceae bacterium]
SRESWQRMSINSLGYAGLLFVPEQSQLEVVTQTGPLNILKAVTAPR